MNIPCSIATPDSSPIFPIPLYRGSAECGLFRFQIRRYGPGMDPRKIVAVRGMFYQALSVGLEASFPQKNPIDPFNIPPRNPATGVAFRILEKP
jgi:hypothetical protein